MAHSTQMCYENPLKAELSGMIFLSKEYVDMKASESSQDVLKKQLHSEFETYLIAHGHRLTRQRKTILDAVLIADQHTNAEQVTAKAREIDSSIGLATVYRTLQLMTECGILVGRQFGADRQQFEVSADSSSHHDHLICQDCGDVIEFCNDDLEKIKEKIAESLGYSLTGHRLELFGKCKNSTHCRCKDKK